MTDIEKLRDLLNKYSLLSSHTIINLSKFDEDQLLTYTEQREAIVNEMSSYSSLLTDDMKAEIKQLLVGEGVIVERMLAIKNEAAEWLEKRENIRSQQNAYQQSYSSGSIFIDYRK
ncbi:hypothetical protein GCM10008014_42770 [Paenibacillus silvae]|uniref:Flagellar protein FliT n=1 Tax=Paenibacillus silvae TaxID=1325358 RepID=A0ABQ1ZIP1_9BACL|nr:hypothetical protein [Paenibacillus silvae]GGH64414.1 hypothetical protein GCM10008014_42770 [Paenibacillus silvae]